MRRRQIAGLEGLERREFAQPLAGFDEGRILEPAILARLGVGERMLAADAHHEIGIVEVHRPFFAGADDERRDPGGFELLHRAEKIVPGLDVLGLHARLLEQLLVVVEGDLAHLERHADDLAVDLERVDRGRGEVGVPRADVLGDVLQEPGLVLRLHDAAAPAVEQVRTRLVGLQHGRQLGLEGFVLQILELDVHAGMRGVVILGDLVPDRFLGGVVANVKDSDLGIGESRGGQRGEASRSERELAKIHGFPPKGSGLGGVLFVRDAD